MRNETPNSHLTLMVTAALAALGASPPPDTGATLPWKTVAASGTVEARAADATPEAEWQAVSRGEQFPPATLVRTGNRGRITLTRSANLLILNPNSQVELTDQPPHGLETSVVQTAGSVLYEVDPRTRPHFEVVTPYLVAGVKGTKFLVTVNESYTAVTVREGLVEVAHPDTGEIFEVRPGESLFRERDDELELVHEQEGSRAQREARLLARMDHGAPDPTPTTSADASEAPDAEAGDPTASNGVDSPNEAFGSEAAVDSTWTETDVFNDWLDAEIGGLDGGGIGEAWHEGPAPDVDDDDDQYDEYVGCVTQAAMTTCLGSGIGSGTTASATEPPTVKAAAGDSSQAADQLNLLLDEQAGQRHEEAAGAEPQDVDVRGRRERERSRRER